MDDKLTKMIAHAPEVIEALVRDLESATAERDEALAKIAKLESILSTRPGIMTTTDGADGSTGIPTTHDQQFLPDELREQLRSRGTQDILGQTPSWIKEFEAGQEHRPGADVTPEKPQPPTESTKTDPLPLEDLDNRIKKINSQLKAEIALRNENLKTVTSRAGLNYGVTRRYITGEREMPLKVFLQLCAAIGVTPDEVLKRAQAQYQASI